MAFYLSGGHFEVSEEAFWTVLDQQPVEGHTTMICDPAFTTYFPLGNVNPQNENGIAAMVHDRNGATMKPEPRFYVAKDGTPGLMIEEGK